MSDGGLEAVLLGNRAALLRFIRARGGPADAEDLLQELWLKLSATPPAGPIADPLAYIYKIADNMMHDRRRATLRRERRETQWTEAETGVTPEASSAPSAERILSARDELARVAQALAELGERTDHIFRRFRIDGASQKVIAAEQGISLSAVEKHLQRAYRAIVRLHSGNGDTDGDAGLPDRRRLGSEEPKDVAR
ncbi:sigma-70 family RNA polymerase sigma factor [Sphingomonas solaris]|uniref:Sigma-70 family RNA polymerase sigma factor n=1 Tax=Alterirhizorhabdus solaris TaxID=2529389 RepID=A0A558R502_9SPHN|nr:sigma-70 family RNA polymerase sigma factor [Sphingomonas solaris]TVV74453.1 sigma-70 family RNA polymerase sigma factor [Sphingomonas solaris]